MTQSAKMQENFIVVTSTAEGEDLLSFDFVRDDLMQIEYQSLRAFEPSAFILGYKARMTLLVRQADVVYAYVVTPKRSLMSLLRTRCTVCNRSINGSLQLQSPKAKPNDNKTEITIVVYFSIGS